MASTKTTARRTGKTRKKDNGTGGKETYLRAIIDNVLDGIITIDGRGTVESFNAPAERMFGYSATEVIGNNINMLMPEPYHSEHDGYLARYLETGKARIVGIGREVTGKRKDGSTVPINLAVTAMAVGERKLFVGILRDITERKEAERTIAEQHSLLMELSSPVLKVWNKVVLLPLVGTIDGERANTIIESLLEAIVKNEASVAVIDVTGVPMIDTYVAQHLMKTVSAAEMLGAKVLITGIIPEVARTLVKLGIDLTSLRACGPLRSGIAEALTLTGNSMTRNLPGETSQKAYPL